MWGQAGVEEGPPHRAAHASPSCTQPPRAGRPPPAATSYGPKAGGAALPSLVGPGLRALSGCPLQPADCVSLRHFDPERKSCLSPRPCLWGGLAGTWPLACCPVTCRAHTLPGILPGPPVQWACLWLQLICSQAPGRVPPPQPPPTSTSSGTGCQPVLGFRADSPEAGAMQCVNVASFGRFQPT